MSSEEDGAAGGRGFGGGGDGTCGRVDSPDEGVFVVRRSSRRRQPHNGIHDAGQMTAEEATMDELYDEEEDGGESSARVILTISAKNIKDTDLESVSDPFCVVSECDAGMMQRQRNWVEIGRTETIGNCLDPEWSTKIELNYRFEKQQRLQFQVFDKGHLNKNTAIGSATMLLHELMGAKSCRKALPLIEEGKHYGTITVAAELLSRGRQKTIYFSCAAERLDRKDFLGKCDPFLKIWRRNEDGTHQLAYRSKFRSQTLNPRWKPFEVHYQLLCYEDPNREFLIECFDWDQDGKHDLVGECRVSLNQLLQGLKQSSPYRVKLVHPRKADRSRKYVDSGELLFHRVYLWLDFTFLDFIRGGTELDFMLAVDFTSSNLPAEHASSLHRIDETSCNQYEIAIRSVAEICQHYNASKVFHAYGFGAQLPPDYKTHFNFPLDVITRDPCVVGVEGLLNAYQCAQSTVRFSGPAAFAPVIRFAARRAASLQPAGRRYLVMLIVTDGVITDMEKTKEEIVKASSLPLSIIIVGVGYDSFDEMRVLDSDSQLLHSGGRFARRDIVQFVQMRSFLPPHRALSAQEVQRAKAQLANEVLHEVPAQLTGYMKSKGVFPSMLSAADRAAVADVVESARAAGQIYVLGDGEETSEETYSPHEGHTPSPPWASTSSMAVPGMERAASMMIRSSTAGGGGGSGSGGGGGSQPSTPGTRLGTGSPLCQAHSFRAPNEQRPHHRRMLPMAPDEELRRLGVRD